MNIYLAIIIGVIAGEYILDCVVNILNVRAADPVLAQEFAGFYDSDKYRKSQEYLKDCTVFSLITTGITKIITIGFILAGGFNWVDMIARGWGLNQIWTGVIFTAILILLSKIISIPVSWYSVFVIEEKYGFNRTKLGTFFSDIVKGILLTLIIGGPVLALIIWFFSVTGAMAWVYCWLVVVVIELFLYFISPVLILPLFNKFTPLADGELKTAITEYAKKENFTIQGIFTMDGSRRSAKSNAFFTGIGKFRRIVFYDTLTEKHTVAEIMAILAHEMGHYKKRHILKMIAISVMTSAAMFFILSLFMNNRQLFDAFKMQELSIYASLVFFGFLYAPINMVLSVWSNVISRKHEFEADQYSVKTYPDKDAMILGLKKLTVDNLGNLTPHPLKVFFDYSHPPMLQRINAIKSLIRK